MSLMLPYAKLPTRSGEEPHYLQAVSALSKAFALTVPHDEALAIRDEVGLFQEIRANLVKATVSSAARSPEEMEAAVQQLELLSNLVYRRLGRTL